MTIQGNGLQEGRAVEIPSGRNELEVFEEQKGIRISERQ